jgi:hypothetical protein
MNTLNRLIAIKNLKFEDVDWSDHAIQRLKSREVSLEELVECINNPSKIHPCFNDSEAAIYRGKNITAIVNVVKKILVTVYRTTNGNGHAKRKERLNKIVKRKRGLKKNPHKIYEEVFR